MTIQRTYLASRSKSIRRGKSWESVSFVFYGGFYRIHRGALVIAIEEARDRETIAEDNPQARLENCR